MLRIIHTADWHLGHTLHGHGREGEHRLFLSWLLEKLTLQPADVLLVAGDVFDAANPTVAALTLFYDFLASLRERFPRLQIILIAGNHDSAPRLEAPGALLAPLGVRVVGTLPPVEEWAERLLIPLRNQEGQVEAWCGAVPFLRLVDLPRVAADDPLIAGVAAVYQQVWQALRQRLEPGQGVVFTGHCYMSGSAVSELSERKILMGHQHALPLAIFPQEATYVALGHLHLAQRVGHCSHVRYSGSPLPLSMGESGYAHQVLRVEMAGATLVRVEPLLTPRGVGLMRLPERGALAPEALLASLATLADGVPDEQAPFLEVAVCGDISAGGVRRRIEEILEGKAVRLVKLGVHHEGAEGSLQAEQESSLMELAPEEVFKRCFRQRYGDEAPAPWLAAFHELVERVEGEGGP